MTSNYKLLVVICLLITSCKSDKNSTKVEESSDEIVVKVSDSQRMLRNIESAHNTTKFKSEDQVKFQLKFSLENNVFFDGYVTLKTDGSQARYLDSNMDKTLESSDLKTDVDKKLYMIAELYTMGFWFKPENFNLISKDDNLDLSSYHSESLDSDYKIYSHPLTHIIQQVDFETIINEKPFNKGSLKYDKYITVNRIPVALKWTISLDQQQIATAEISRISYPKTF